MREADAAPARGVVGSREAAVGPIPPAPGTRETGAALTLPGQGTQGGHARGGAPLSRRALVAGSLLAGLAAPIVTAGALEARRLERLAGQDSLPPAVRARLVPAMREAIAEARLAYYQFGAVLLDVDSGQTVYRAHNNTESGDPTAHGEMNALRGAGLAGVDLTKTVVVTTAECCPMCAAAAVWANVAGVVFETSIATAIRYGWGQIDIPMVDVLARSTFNQIPVVGGILTEETDPLYAAGEPPAPPRSS